MASQVSRRGFLRRATLCDDSSALRPPGAHPDLFLDLCKDCDLCQSACPEDVLVIDEGGRPQFAPTRGACTFCGICAEVCPTGALDLARMGDWPWRSAVSSACLSMQGVACRTCEDSCDARAISFRLQVGGSAQPKIDPDQCTGCGNCVASCPVGAVSLTNHHQKERENVA
jgi:ferredoxin-type protein NapF